MTLPYEGATAEQLQSTFVRELLMIHGMFRDQLGAILEFVNDWIEGGQPADTARAQRLAQAGIQYTQILHHHHHLETASVFPSLQRQGLEMSVIDRLNADHDELSILLDKFAETLQNGSIIPETIYQDLRKLSQALQAHLAYEETHICPLLAHWSNWPR